VSTQTAFFFIFLEHDTKWRAQGVFLLDPKCFLSGFSFFLSMILPKGMVKSNQATTCLLAQNRFFRPGSKGHLSNRREIRAFRWVTKARKTSWKAEIGTEGGFSHKVIVKLWWKFEQSRLHQSVDGSLEGIKVPHKNTTQIVVKFNQLAILSFIPMHTPHKQTNC
jgi:hypothetical protein